MAGSNKEEIITSLEEYRDILFDVNKFQADGLGWIINRIREELQDKPNKNQTVLEV